MARITVEDCLIKVDNQYDLVLLAKERASQLNSGSEILVKENNDIEIAGIITERQKTNFPSLNSYTFDDLPINVDAYILTEINQFQEYYKKIKKVATTQEILIPKFLKLSKGKRNE